MVSTKFLFCFFLVNVFSSTAASSGTGSINIVASETATTVTATTKTVTQTATTSEATAAAISTDHLTACNNQASMHFNCAGLCVKLEKNSAKVCRPIAYNTMYQHKCGGKRVQCTPVSDNGCAYPPKASFEAAPAANTIAEYCPECGDGYRFSRNMDACVTQEFYEMDISLINQYQANSFDTVGDDASSYFGGSATPGPGCVHNTAQGGNLCTINHCSALMQTFDKDLAEVAQKTFFEDNKPMGWAKMSRDTQVSQLSKLFWQNFVEQIDSAYTTYSDAEKTTVAKSMECTDTIMGFDTIATPPKWQDNYAKKWNSMVSDINGDSTTQLNTMCQCAKYYVHPYVKDHFENHLGYAAPLYSNGKLPGSSDTRFNRKEGAWITAMVLSFGYGCAPIAMMLRKKNSGDNAAAFSLIY